MSGTASLTELLARLAARAAHPSPGPGFSVGGFPPPGAPAVAPRARWWRRWAVAAVLVEPVTPLVASVVVVVGAVRLAEDPFLWFLGMLAVVAALVATLVALAFAGVGVAIARKVTAGHAAARWYVLAYGAAGLLPAVAAVVGGLHAPWVFGPLLVASAVAVTLGVHAPPEREQVGPIIE